MIWWQAHFRKPPYHTYYINLDDWASSVSPSGNIILGQPRLESVAVKSPSTKLG